MTNSSKELETAIRYHQGGKLREAEAIYRSLTQAEPNNATVWHLLGLIAFQKGQPEAAVEFIRRAIAIGPPDPMFYSNLGAAEIALGRFENAIEHCQKAIALSDRLFEAHENLARAYHKKGRVREAAASFQNAANLRPQDPVLLCNLGNTLIQQGKIREGMANCLEALRLNPDLAPGYASLGLALQKQGQNDEAIVCYREALRRDPKLATAANQLGNVYRTLGRFEEARQSYEQALQLEEKSSEAQFHLGILDLLHGNFQKGWPGFEKRWECQGYPPRPFDKIVWDGSSLQGKTILLHEEQGYGDSIQFLRYVSLVKLLGAKTLLYARPEIAQLLATAHGVDRVIVKGSKIPKFDCQSSLLSLPAIFQKRSEEIPVQFPYLGVDSKLKKNWQERVENLKGVKVGFCWRGNPAQVENRQRSIPFERFLPLFKLPNFHWFSLLKDSRAEEFGAYRERFSIADWGPEFVSFSDTAAAIDSLDLVISVDTSIAHLAGALGKTTYLALSFVPDWRWQLERDDSPWYPNMRLFRQPRLGDWDSVIQKISEELLRRHQNH